VQLEREPDCADCGKPAIIADHEPPRHVLEALGFDPDDGSWYVSRCWSCHTTKTNEHDQRALGPAAGDR
jgi:hypothetical protein